ncbi:MAG: UDP-N-acetylmuramate dehydrogenase [Synergistaceae bacterium]|nr:UDP-N-acetylmuramate dehydrogenase [Synergistaceae bacterium]
MAVRLRSLDAGSITCDESLSAHGSWRIGGPADIFVQPSDCDQVVRLVQFTREENLPLVVIGKGTNLLFSDEGFRGVVMKLGSPFSGLWIEGESVRIQAGLWVPRLVRNLAAAGLSGLEHAAGIPGSVGGLVTMNGGSLRRSVGEIIITVKAVNREGRLRVFSAEECGFSYRRSIFQDEHEGERWIVLEAILSLERAERRDVRAEALRIMEERRRKFPLRLPNCGSVFTNSPEVYEIAGPPGKVVEDTGLKGLTVGGAQVSHHHANFIVNTGGATSRDVLALIGEVRRRVHDRIGAWLACEVRYVDPDGKVVPASEACE